MQISPGRLRRRVLASALTLSSLLLIGVAPVPALASSHREAPLITEDPVADNTDVYAFTSPDRADTVTLVANFVPFQKPAGGPNFYPFGDDVLYQIHVDNVGDARSHLTFNYRFNTKTVNPGTFSYNNIPPGAITCSGHTYQGLNRPQTYTLTMTRDDGNGLLDNLLPDGGEVIGSGLATPPSIVGPKTTPNYDKLAQCANYQGLPHGISSFAGQRDDPFFADLGKIFDTLDLGMTPKTDYLAGLNVNTIAIQVPKSLLHGPNAKDPVIGVWSTAARHRVSVLNPNGTKDSEGPWTQVSRLGNPLVNEVVIPVGTKDRFNASNPRDDAQFASHVVKPELAGYEKLLFDKDIPTENRQDLVATFLTGIPALGNKPVNVRDSELLRLNMETAVTHTNPNDVNRLGALGEFLGGKAAEGYPNGRRLGDDVVDISILAVAGVLCEPMTAKALGTAQCRNTNVNLGLGDGVDHNDVAFGTTFPYVAGPHAP